MGMGFAPTSAWLPQVSPPASHDHFNHWADQELRVLRRMWAGWWPYVKSRRSATDMSVNSWNVNKCGIRLHLVASSFQSHPRRGKQRACLAANVFL